MFLPEVPNILLPMTLAPVVSPTSCLIEPRYSTFLDITASGRAGAGGSADAGAAKASSRSDMARGARSGGITRNINAREGRKLHAVIVSAHDRCHRPLR